jgi:hypothetical protein
MRLVFSFLQNKQDYSIASEKTHGRGSGMKASRTIFLDILDKKQTYDLSCSQNSNKEVIP